MMRASGMTCSLCGANSQRSDIGAVRMALSQSQSSRYGTVKRATMLKTMNTASVVRPSTNCHRASGNGNGESDGTLTDGTIAGDGSVENSEKKVSRQPRGAMGLTLSQ